MRQIWQLALSIGKPYVTSSPIKVSIGAILENNVLSQSNGLVVPIFADNPTGESNLMFAPLEDLSTLDSHKVVYFVMSLFVYKTKLNLYKNYPNCIK